MRITPKQLAQTLYDLTVGRSKPEIEKSVSAFARYIYRNRKLKLADRIAKQFATIYNQKKGIVEAQITTRKKLNEAELKKAKQYVQGKYGAKEVVLKNIADENVKGGFVLRVGDEVTDGSLRGRLGELRKILT